MIYLVGQAQTELGVTPVHKSASFEQFMHWTLHKTVLQLDTETNVCSSILDRELILVQFGDVYGKNQWLLQWSALSEYERHFVGRLVADPSVLLLIQNASFEYQIFRKQGFYLTHVFDTMLASKILNTGIDTPIGFHSLAGLLHRHWGIDLSKAEQTTFGDNLLTSDKIRYAALDVKYLGSLFIEQKYALNAHRLEFTAALEMETVLGLAEMEYTGMKLDGDKWLANVALAQPVIDKYKDELDAFLRNEQFYDFACETGFVLPEDKLTIPWGSPKVREELLLLLFPSLTGATKPVVTKYLKSVDEATRTHIALKAYLDKDYDELEDWLSADHGALLEERGYFMAKGTTLLNWGSPPQRLKVFQFVMPKLKGTSKEELAKCDHPIIEAYQEYINATKLTGSFGEKFLTEHQHADGRVRTRFNQIINTGRVSCSSPNMQQIPAKENVGTRYRNAFVEEPGWLFVDSDYASQELVLIAFFSKDPVWAEALNQGQDLHSVCAEQVFGQKWKDAADADCAYYHNNKDKCKCKRHKTLRTLVKTINFGLAYGMSKYKLSSTAKISLEEAQQTIDDYFQAFPGIGGKLEQFGAFGKRNGYILTPPPFYRKRYFGDWHPDLNDHDMGAIERASKNMPIQGAAADITKAAVCLVYWQMRKPEWEGKVRLVAAVHDQLTCTVKEELAPAWKIIMHECMLEAARLVIPTGQLGADTQITPYWTK